MKKETETLRLTRMLWPLALGLGLVLGLLWIVIPHSAVEAQALEPAAAAGSMSTTEVDLEPRGNDTQAAQINENVLPLSISDPLPSLDRRTASDLALPLRATGRAPMLASAGDGANALLLTPPLPGSTDLAICPDTDRVWGVVGAGETVTVTADGAQMGAAMADGNGFFWTTLYDANGDRPNIGAGDTVAIYHDGVQEASVTLRSITGTVDVVNNVVSGTIGGVSSPISVTLYWAGSSGQPAMNSYSQTVSTDSSGNFTADISGIWDIIADDSIEVAYVEGGVEVHRHIYATRVVVRPDPANSANGWASPGSVVTATVYSDAVTIRDQTVGAAGANGRYEIGVEILTNDTVIVELADGTVMSRTVDILTENIDPANNRITGTSVPGTVVRGIVGGNLTSLGRRAVQNSAIAVGGVYTIEFSGLADIMPGQWSGVYVADADGDDLAVWRPVAPSVEVNQTYDDVSGYGAVPFGQGDGWPVTLTLYSAVSDTTFVYSKGMEDWFGRYSFNQDDGLPDIAPGDVVTVESQGFAWQGVVQVQTMTVQHDTDADQFTGDVETPSDRVELWGMQWEDFSAGSLYPLAGTFDTLTTASSPFAVTVDGFDVRNGVGYQVGHRTADDYVERISNKVDYLRVWPWYNGTYIHCGPPGTAYTITLRNGSGAFKAELTGTSGEPTGWAGWHNFWDEDAQIEAGDQIQAQSAAGFSQTIHIPETAIQIDRVNDTVSGEGPANALLYVSVDGQGDGFVPTDGSGQFIVAVDQLQNFYGDGDLTWGDWAMACAADEYANYICWGFDWPQVIAHYQMDDSNDVWGENAIPGNVIYMTVTHPVSGVVATGTTTAGACDWCGPTSYQLEFPDSTIVPSNTVHVDFGGGFVYSTTVVSITAQANPDSDVVTVTAPISSWVNMNASDPYDNWWESDWSYGSLQVGASGYVTFDLSVDGFNIIPGTSFNVHVGDTQYTFWLPAPDLSIDKWNTNGYARPDGIVVYGIDYWNNGNGVATDTLVVDTLPISTTWAGDTSGVVPTIGAGGVITWNLGDVEAGDGDSFIVTLNVFGLSDGDSIDPNCAVITTTTPGDYDLSNNGPSCADPVDVWDDDVEVGVDKWPNPGDPTPGQEFEYTVQPCNYRGAAAGPLWLTDTLPLSTTFVSWDSDRGDTTYWTEVVTTGGQLVLYAPGLPGDECEDLHLRLLLDADVPISTTLENTVVITAAGDVDTDNNGPYVNTDAHVSGPRYDMTLDKRVHNYVPVPGGWVNYFFDYYNNGNMPTHIWITDTVPTGLSYDYAFWGGNQPQQDDPFPAPTIIGDKLVWDLGIVAAGDSAWFHVQMSISDTLTPGDTLTNCATVGITATENTPGDNTSCYPITLNASGPNLRVTKNSWWNGNGQLGYQIYFANQGDETVSDVWITDTLPVSTAYDGWWGWEGFNFDEGRLVSDTQSSDELRWQFSSLEPGDRGWLYFNVNLDTPGQPLRWYTNTVEIAIPSSDTNPDDNVYEDVAFSGGEVESADLDVYRTRIWGCAYDTPITITSVLTQMVIDWDTCWDEDFGDTFDPGDVVTVTAGAGVHPVVIHVPDPFTAYASSITDTVWGQIDGATYEPVDVDLWGFPTRRVQTDGNGNYSATFPDVPRGAQGDVNYYVEIDYADVGFHRRFQTLDLILNVNYGHDWVNGHYEPGHTVWITVTESDSVTVKATAVLATGPIPEWGGDSGFETRWDDWSPNQPDIQVGDWVFGLADNGQGTQVRIGTITGTVDVDDDSITGRIYAPWFTETLSVECQEWAGVGAPNKDSTAGPDGDPPYYCQWDPGTEWDVQPGQDIGVRYQGPDLNWVLNVFREPQPYVHIEKSANGNPAEGGNFRFNIQYWNDGGDGDYAENVLITDTLLGGMTYITDTSGLPHTGSGSGPIVWDLGTVPGNSGYNFDVFVAITAGQGDPITNTVEITTSSPYNQSGPGERYSEWNGTVQANDTWLSVGKWIEAPNPAPGTDFDWRVNVCNEGSTASSEVTLTDTLPISTTLLNWWGDTPGWTEVLNTSDRLVLSYPSVPDGQCTSAYLRFHLDEDAWIGMQISNTATISASNDLNGGSTAEDWRDVYGPFSNLYVRKDWLQGQLVPGSELSYWVNYGNDGNAPADDVWLTYTLPASTTFSNAWWNDQYGQHPFPPDTVTDDYVVWDLGTLENGFDSNFEVRLGVDGSASPGTVLTSTFEITPHPSDFHYDDNAVTWAEILNDTGPNLAVHKQNYRWNGTSQIQYEMRVKNRGDERIEPVWITDTYPISTTWDGNWWYGHGPWITTTHDVPNRQIVFWLEYLDPGDTASIHFYVDLDGPIQGEQGLFFTNTLEAPLPGDVYSADNYDEVVAYAGPDVYAEKWLRSGEPRPGEIVTFTVKFGNRNSWDGMDGMWGSYITDTLPPEMTFITATTPWDPNQRWMPGEITATNSMTWSWGTPWPNETNYFAIVAQITDTVQSGDVVTNVVEYWSDDPDDVDLSLGNNIFELPLTILDPAFEVGKVYQGNVAGTVVTYTLTVTNVGNYPGTNVVLSDTVPAYLEGVGSSGALNLGWVWWNLGTIASDGDAATAWFSATLPCTASLSIDNDDYGVRSSDQGVSGPAGAPVSFAVVEPTISVEITHTPGTIVVSDTVTFTATAGTDGTGLSYEWDLGDGAMSGGLTATQVYTQDGDYTVVFSATDTCGYSEAATVTVTVNPPSLVANFDHSPDPANILVNGTVMFTDTSTTDVPPIVAWMWDFGDDSAPAFTQDTSHVYDTVGTYTVTLVVTDALGYSDNEVKTNVVTVSLACTPVTSVTFAYAPLYPTIQSPVVFTATVTPSGATQPITYIWDFGDGVTSTATIASTSHTYTTSGTMTVGVTAYNPCTPAGVSSASADIEVASLRVFLPLVLRNY